MYYILNPERHGYSYLLFDNRGQCVKIVHGFKSRQEAESAAIEAIE